MLRLWLHGQHGVPVLRTAGLSGWAPCRLRRHGHSASIPHAFAPAALRALLASRGKPCGYPRRATLGAPRRRRTGLRRIGGYRPWTARRNGRLCDCFRLRV